MIYTDTEWSSSCFVSYHFIDTNMWFITSHSYLSSLGFPPRKTVTECKCNLSEFLFNVVILWCIECNTLSFHYDYWSLMMPSGPQMWEAMKQDPLRLSAFIAANEDCGYLIGKFGAHSFFSFCHVDPPEICFLSAKEITPAKLFCESTLG